MMRKFRVSFERLNDYCRLVVIGRYKNKDLTPIAAHEPEQKAIAAGYET
jgi:hypothetical protein